MIKVILFDVDGLVIEPRTQFFSEKLAEEQGVSKESVAEFFQGNFKKCTFGKADLKEEIVPFLLKWKWDGTVDELLDHWFSSERVTVSEVLEIIQMLRAKGIRCYIATRQEKYRLQYLLDDIGLATHFDGVFCTCIIGYDKKDSEFFDYVITELGVEPSEVLFFDDTQINIETAQAKGIEAYFYDGIAVLKEHTQNL